jgi:hypothetical protein
MADLEQLLTRRRALQWAGGVGFAAFVTACADDGGSSAASSSSTTEAAAASVPDCVLMPELTEGPYYLDLDLVRSDVTGDRPGLPLDLRVTVVDADACEPVEGAAVDVWHCDAGGAYSGVQGAEGETFCRGVQIPTRTASPSSAPSSRVGTRAGRCTSTSRRRSTATRPTPASSSSTQR